MKKETNPNEEPAPIDDGYTGGGSGVNNKPLKSNIKKIFIAGAICVVVIIALIIIF